MAEVPAARPSDAPANSKVGRNFLAVGGGEVIARLIAFGAYVYLARALGADGYGVIAFVGGVHLYLMKVAEFSLDSAGASHVARVKQGLGRLVMSVLATRLGITLAAILVCGGASTWLLPQPERLVLQVYLLALVPLTLSTKWVHLGLQDAAPVGLSRVLAEGIFLLTVLTLVHSHDDLWKVPVGTILGETSASLMLYGLLLRGGMESDFRLDLKGALPLFKKAAPLVVQVMLGLVIYNSDVLFLRAMRDGETVGYYAAAYMLLSFLGNIAISYGTTLIPALARETAGSRAETRLYHDSLAQVFAVAMPIAIGGCLVAPEVVALWFGEGYGPAGGALALLIWALPGTTFRVAPWAALVVRSKEGLLLRATIVAVVLNAALNYLLIDRLGMQGAALATIATETLTGFMMLRYAALQGLSFIALGRLLPPLLAGALMAGAVFLATDLHLFIRIALGGLSYVLGLAIFGVLRIRQGRPVVRL